MFFYDIIETMKTFFNLLRVKQYIKNLFIFMPLFFGIKLNDSGLFLNTFFAFFSFSFVASGIYILNDLLDLREDKNHPKKRKRPLASGEISTKTAKLILILCFAVGLFSGYMQNIHLFYILLVYAVLNFFYSFKIKHIPVVDIFVIAVGFVLRLFAGSAVTGISLSRWIVLMSFLLALFLALGKRRDDLVILSTEGKKMRKSIDGYSVEMVNLSLGVMAAVILVSYISYTMSGEVMEKLHTENLYLTTVFVLFGLMRYFQIIFVENNAGSPTEIMLKDRAIQFSVLGWALSVFVILYQ
jgi:4-hydroxybenzoate polyprenyltransferase